jgi:hypothetical protein
MSRGKLKEKFSIESLSFKEEQEGGFFILRDCL